MEDEEYTNIEDYLPLRMHSAVYGYGVNIEKKDRSVFPHTQYSFDML